MAPTVAIVGRRPGREAMVPDHERFASACPLQLRLVGWAHGTNSHDEAFCSTFGGRGGTFQIFLGGVTNKMHGLPNTRQAISSANLGRDHREIGKAST